MVRLFSSSRRYSSRTDDTFSQKRCLCWFSEYTTAAEPETLGPESMERFCEDIGVEPENVAMLVLAYKMGARQMGYFTQTEWMKGMTELQCDSAAKMPAKLDAMRAGLSDYTAFKGVYRYAYDFARVSVCVFVCAWFVNKLYMKTLPANVWVNRSWGGNIQEPLIYLSGNLITIYIDIKL